MSSSSPSSGPPASSNRSARSAGAGDVYHVDNLDDTPSPFSHRPRVRNTYGRRSTGRTPFRSSPLTTTFLAGAARGASSPLSARSVNARAVPSISSPVRRDGSEDGATTWVAPDKHEKKAEGPADRENIEAARPRHDQSPVSLSSLDPQPASSKPKRNADDAHLSRDSPSLKRAKHNGAEQARDASPVALAFSATTELINVGDQAEDDSGEDEHSHRGGDTTEDEIAEPDPAGPMSSPHVNDFPEPSESVPWPPSESLLDFGSSPMLPNSHGTVDYNVNANVEDSIVGQESTLLTVMTTTSLDDEDHAAASSPASSLASFADELSSPVNKKKSTGADVSAERPATTAVVSAATNKTTEREQASASPFPTPSNSSSTTSYTIHTITDFRTIQGDGPVCVELRVSWEDYPDPAEDTWEDESAIHESAPDAVFAFWKARGGRSAALGLGVDAEFDVLRVCAHRRMRRQGTGKKRKNKGAAGARNRKKEEDVGGGQEKEKLQFLVEWVGYAEKTWEPAEGLPRDMVTEYCAAKGLVVSPTQGGT